MSNLLASAWRRLLAFGLDFLLIALYMTALTLVSVATWKAWIGRMPGPADAGPLAFDALSFVTLVLPVILYFAVSESLPQRGTWGKRRAGVVVTSLSGARLGFGRSLLRSGLKFLPWQIAHSSLFHIPGWPTAVEAIPAAAALGLTISLVLAAGYLGSLFLSRDGRAPYDRLAGSQVIRRP